MICHLRMLDARKQAAGGGLLDADMLGPLAVKVAKVVLHKHC